MRQAFYKQQPTILMEVSSDFKSKTHIRIYTSEDLIAVSVAL